MWGVLGKKQNPGNQKARQHKKEINTGLSDNGVLNEARGLTMMANKVEDHYHQRGHRANPVQAGYMRR